MRILSGEATINSPGVLLSTVLLSWNRPAMLERTLMSYRGTTSLPHELIVVDNASSRDTRTLLESAEASGLVDAVIFVAQNEGGSSLNYPLPFLKGSYIHFSENDIDYRPHWDTRLLAKFSAFPWLGQLSPFGPRPEVDKGEIWVEHPGHAETRDGQSIVTTHWGVGTTCIVRREVIDKGARWATIEAGTRRWPNDAAFSSKVRALGYIVAWNDAYVAGNLGHTAQEWNEDLGYYLESYAAKRWVGLPGLERRLRNAGHEFVRSRNGDIIAVRRSADAQFSSLPRPRPDWS